MKKLGITSQTGVFDDPLALFADWYTEASKALTIDPDIIALATATKDGRPSVRMVLFRGMREGGFSFFTNYESRKGRELAENPFAAIAFYWPHLGKQVRIEGRVSRLSPEESNSYFQQRPLLSRVSAAVSRQSQPMPDEMEFAEELERLEQACAGNIACPPTWGGFKLIPSTLEFWTHQDNRRHIRFLYEKDGDDWKKSRLYP